MVSADPKDLYNQIEPFIWYVVAVLIVPALRRHAPAVERVTLAGVVALFGTSDFFESDAWWTPWWLLAWKATTLSIGIFIAVRIWLRARRRA
jgi:hypothetical protein